MQAYLQKMKYLANINYFLLKRKILGFEKTKKAQN